MLFPISRGAIVVKKTRHYKRDNMMKSIIALLLLCMTFATSSAAEPQDIKDALGKLLGGEKSDESSDEKGGGLLDAIGGLFGGKMRISDLNGTWTYQGPAISFKSDNLLKKAGGVAASTVVENKLKPMYKTAGFDQMVFTVNPDSTFTMKVKLVTLKGTISTNLPKGSTATFMFNFKVAGKMSIGKMEAYVTKTGNKINLTFDVTKLMTLLSKAGSLTGNSSLKTLSKLLDSYDGMCAGFELKRTAASK